MTLPRTAADTAPAGAPDDAATEALAAGAIRRRAARGVLAVTFSGLGVRVLALAGNIALARLLTPHDFGMVALGLAILTFGGFLASGGFGATLMRQSETPDPRDLGAMLGFQLVLAVAFGAVVAAIGLATGPVGALMAVMAVTLPLDVARVPAAVLAERNLRYRPIVLSQLAEASAYYIWAIVAAVLGAGVWALATGAVVRAAVGSVALIAAVPQSLVRPRLDKRRVRRLFGFGMRFQAVGAVNLARDQGLNVAVASIAGVTALGLWTVAFRLMQAVMMLFDALWRVSFPAMARLIDAGEDPRPLLERGVAVTSTAAGFIVVALGGSASELVPTLLGDQWSDAATILPWAAVGVAIAGPLSACAAGYLYAIGDARTALRAAIVHTVAWFATSLPLLGPIGVEALGIGWLVACLADCAVFAPAVRRHAGTRVLRILAPPVVAATLGVGCGVLVGRSLDTSMASVVATIVAAETVYCALILTSYRAPLMDLIGVIDRTVRPAT